jgi:hypothetical protein
LVAVCLLFFGGCGGGEDLPPNFKTTVEVTYNGAAVDGATVTLRPDGHEAPSANGVTGADGTVDLFSYKGKGDGVIPGNYLVGIEQQEVEAVEMIDSEAAAEVDTSDGSTYKERVDLLPAKYISAATSGLKCTVTEDAAQNVFKFELED